MKKESVSFKLIFKPQTARICGVFVVTVFLLMINSFSLKGEISPGKKLQILVYPFENSGTGQYSWISGGMTESVISDLSRISSIAVFTQDDRKKAIKEIELGMTGLIKESDIVKVGTIMGANLIFSGNYTVSGSKIRVNAKLISIESGSVEKSIKLDGTTDKIFELQDSIVSNLMAAAEKVNIADVKKPVFTDKDRENIRKIPRMNEKAFELYSRGWEVYEKEPVKALNLFVKAYIIDKENYYIKTAIAGAMSITGDIDGATHFYKSASDLLKSYGMENSTEAASLQYSIGLNCWNRGDFKGAADYTAKAYRILESAGEERSRLAAAVLMLNGGAYRGLNRLDDATRNTEISIEIYNSLGLKNTGDYAWGLNNLGVIYSMKGESDKAVANYLDAKKIWEGIGLKESMGIAYTNCQIGYELYLKKDYKQALDFLLAGKKMCDRLKLNNSFNYAYYMWYTALVYNQLQGSGCDARNHMQLAVDIFEMQKNPVLDQAKKALSEMSGKCKKQGK